MSFLTALLDQQASKTQPELPTGGDTKTAFRLPASKSLPALKPSASSSSLQVVNIEVPSSDLNILLEKPLGSRRRSTRGGSLKSTLARARESQRAEEEAHESAAERKARQMREARDRARDACRRGEWSRADEALTEALGVAAQPKRSAAYEARLYASRSMVSLSRTPAEPTRALDDADAAVAADPRQPAGFFRQGRALAHAPQRLPEAAQAFVHTLSLDPTNTRAHLGFGAALAGIRRQRYSWPVPPKGTWEPRTTSLRGRQADVRAHRVLASTPPLAVTAPRRPAPPEVGECTTSTIAVSWREVEFDGGDDVNQYELQVARVDPLDTAAQLQYESCFVVIVDGKWAPAPKGWGDADGSAVAGNPSGGDRLAEVTSVRHERSASRLHCVIDGMDEDDDFVLRLSARNGVGRSEWTDNVRASTLAEAEPELEGLKELPPLWRELVVNLDDVFEQLGLRIDGGAIELDTTKGLIWEELAAALVRHLAALKLAFKMYSLIGSTDDNPNDMSQLQYLRFVKDAQIREHLPDVPPREQGHEVSGVDCDLVFVAANRA